jgi:hypothetical protein
MINPRAELAEYLGPEFNHTKLTGNDALVYDEWRQYKDPVEFYKYNKIYLYHLTVFGQGDQKQLYYQFIREVSQPCSVIDYGCGIGADGLWMSAQYGYKPSFADYDSECTQYLKWRLRKREIDAPVYDIEKDDIPRHALAMSFDVIEHIMTDDQYEFLEAMARAGDLCIVNLNKRQYQPPQGPHFPVDVAGLIEFLREKAAVVSYKIYNEYAHVLAFRSWIDKEEE